jgi:hypothetical protein
MRRVEACIESHEDSLSTNYTRILSAITHKLNVPGHMLIWIFFLVYICGTHAQILSSPFTYTLFIRYEIFMWATSGYFISFFVGLWYRVVREMVTYITEQLTAPIFSPEDVLVYVYQTTSLKSIRPQYEDFQF